MPKQIKRARRNFYRHAHGRSTLLPRDEKLFRLIVISATTLMLLITLLFAGAIGAYAYYSNDLPNPSELSHRDIFLTTKIYDRNGRLLYDIFDSDTGLRTTVHLADISPWLKDATIAVEDPDFYNNPGFDLRGMMRAVFQTASGTQRQGGSTITQQLVKLVLLNNDITLDRKIRELMLSYQVSNMYSKDQVLEWYLNEIYYGNMSYGIGAASESYFGKKVRDLNLAEAAMLAGIPQWPALYNPLINPKAAKSRQEEVLDLMVRHGYISAEEAETAKNTPLKYTTPRTGIEAPHFVMYVRELLESQYGRDQVSRGGLRVYTTLDLDLQHTAEKIVRERVDSYAKLNASNAALVAMRPQTGEVLAMVGSANYFDASISGQVNSALAERQPGSTFKPIAYLAAMQKGYTAATLFFDIPTVFQVGQPYAPENADGKWHGAVLMRQALANSYNVPAVRAVQFAGVDNVIALAHRMGVTTLNRDNFYGLSIGLGSGEVPLLDMTAVYSVLANGGEARGINVPEAERVAGYRNIEPVFILRVEDENGKVLEQFDEKQPASDRVISPDDAYIMTDMLADNNARIPTFGSDSPLKLSRPAAVKTGTTDDSRDNWTIGYTPNLVTGVWVGNNNNQPMLDTSGSTTAAPIWHDFMEQALKNTPVQNFPIPEGLERVKIDALSGTLPGPNTTATTSEIFVRGTAPTQVSSMEQLIKIDPVSGKLWNSTCGNQPVEKRFVIYPPEASNWVRSNNIQQPPTEYCTGSGPVAQGINKVLGLQIYQPEPFSYITHTLTISSSTKSQLQTYKIEIGEGLDPKQWTTLKTLQMQLAPMPVVAPTPTPTRTPARTITNTRTPVATPTPTVTPSPTPLPYIPLAANQLNIIDASKFNGLYTVKISVLDMYKLTDEVTFHVYIDNSPPSVKLSYPAPSPDGISVYRKLTLEATATDNLAIARVEFYIDGVLAGTSTTPPYTLDWYVTPALAGQHRFSVVAYDAAGNRASSSETTLNIKVE